jgi:hypothetical protein
VREHEGEAEKLELSLLAILCALYTLFLATTPFDVIPYCVTTGRCDFRTVIAIMALSPRYLPFRFS